jgi:sulfate/thiosulfate-binding protein
MRHLHLAAAGLALSLAAGAGAKELSLLNVSYDPTRELYQQENAAFAKAYKAKTGDDVTVQQSHGGSGKQARAVIEGLQADVVTLAISSDIDQLYERAKLIPKDWQKQLPHHSVPFTSTIVFLVRKGNPKHIKDWGDLIRPDVAVITPNPKTSGGARYNYLAAWAWARHQGGGSDASAQDFLAKLYKNVPVLDSGARGSTVTFLERGIGDVLLTWENEGSLALNELGQDKVEVVVPSLSIQAEPPVAVVEKVARKKGTYDLAKAYLEFLYSPQGQEIGAKNAYRPTDKAVFDKYKTSFAKLKLVTVDGDFGGWVKAQKTHFADGGTFDQIYKP